MILLHIGNLGVGQGIQMEQNSGKGASEDMCCGGGAAPRPLGT